MVFDFFSGTMLEDTAATPTLTATPTATTSPSMYVQRSGIRTTGGVSDPAIDEHFKRSLGPEEYAAVFNATTTDKETGLSGKYKYNYIENLFACTKNGLNSVWI